MPLRSSQAYRRINSSKFSSNRMNASWVRLKWLRKLSSRGHALSLDVHPGTTQWYFFIGSAFDVVAKGCLLLVCLSRSLVVLNPSILGQPGQPHLKGFLCLKSCFLRKISINFCKPEYCRCTSTRISFSHAFGMLNKITLENWLMPEDSMAMCRLS